jgi:putative oxidoreductase
MYTEDMHMNSIERPSWGIALLRVIVGIVFLMHGGQKLFVFGIHGFAGFLAHAGLPAFLAPIVIAIELLGGAMLILGIGTRVAAVAIAADMLGAILGVHLKNGFFLPTGFEYALTMLIANVALILTGPGKASLDGLRGRRA